MFSFFSQLGNRYNVVLAGGGGGGGNSGQSMGLLLALTYP